MKTRLIPITALLLLLVSAAPARAADSQTAPQPTVTAPQATQLAWQRVGAPDTLNG